MKFIYVCVGKWTKGKCLAHPWLTYMYTGPSIHCSASWEMVNGPHLYSAFIQARYSVDWHSPIHAHIHTPTAESTTQGDSQLIRRNYGEMSCSGTPRHWFFVEFACSIGFSPTPETCQDTLYTLLVTKVRQYKQELVPWAIHCVVAYCSLQVRLGQMQIHELLCGD